IPCWRCGLSNGHVTDTNTPLEKLPIGTLKARNGVGDVAGLLKIEVALNSATCGPPPGPADASSTGPVWLALNCPTVGPTGTPPENEPGLMAKKAVSGFRFGVLANSWAPLKSVTSVELAPAPKNRSALPSPLTSSAVTKMPPVKPGTEGPKAKKA